MSLPQTLDLDVPNTGFGPFGGPKMTDLGGQIDYPWPKHCRVEVDLDPGMLKMGSQNDPFGHIESWDPWDLDISEVPKWSKMAYLDTFGQNEPKPIRTCSGPEQQKHSYWL